MAPGPRSAVAAAVLLGVATGLRSQMGMAALVVFTPSKSLPGFLSARSARPASLFLAAGELVADKLSNLPSRTKMPELLVRTGFGALAGGTAAAITGHNVARAAVIGAITATAASFIGERARVAAAKKVPALVAALAEDALAATYRLSRYGAGQPTGRLGADAER